MRQATRRGTSQTRKHRPRFFTPLRFETLEGRTLLADVSAASTSTAWHNVFDPLDVDADSFVVPHDVLRIINYLNASGPGAVPPGASNGPPFYDTDGDGFVAAIDALTVINASNAFGARAARLPPEARDFAFVALNAAQRTRTLVISNTGTTPIHLSPLQISGSGAADYSLVQPPSSVIAAGSTTSFTLKFDPSASGARPATVLIPNDSVLSNYSIAINGAGVDVQGLAAGAPGTIETVTVQGISLDTTANASIVFTDAGGHEERLVATPVTAAGGSSSFGFAVPPYIDLATFTTSAGTVNIRFEQPVTGGTTRVELGSLAISDLPQTGLAAGAVTMEVLTQLQSFLLTAGQDWQRIAAGSAGAVNATSLVQTFQSLNDAVAQSQGEIQQLISGGVDRLDLGQVSGVSVALDRNGLAVLDRLYAAYLQPPSGGAASAALAPAPFSTQPAASFSTQSVGDFFQSVSCNADPHDVFHTFNQIRARIGALVGLTALTAELLGHEEAAPIGFATGMAVDGFATSGAILYSGGAQLVCRKVFDGQADPDFMRKLYAEIEEANHDAGATTAMGLLGLLGGHLTQILSEVVNTSRHVSEIVGLDAEAVLNSLSRIRDHYAPPTVSINDERRNEGNSGDTSFQFAVTLSKPTHYQSVKVAYSTAVRSGTATSGEDFQSIGLQELVFGPEETLKTITVFVHGDAKHEANELFFVDLISAKYVDTGQALTITRDEGIGTIVNDDSAGVDIRESGGGVIVAEGGVTDTYTIALTSQPTAPVTITLHPDNQVQVSPATMTFNSSNWNVPQTATVTAIDDSVVEGSHTGTITHSVTSGDPDYSSLAIRSVIANITDNDSSTSVLGTWSGPYNYTVPAGPCITHNQGTARLTFTSLGPNGALSGTSFVDGVDDVNIFTCAHVDYSTASGPASGTLTLDEIADGLLDLTNDRFGGNVKIKFTATITGNTMTGKLFDINGVQRGSFTLTKQ